MLSVPLPARRALFPLLHPLCYRNMALRRRLPIGQRGSFAPFEALKCLFIHIPKTAGSSVSQALFQGIVGHHPLHLFQLVYPQDVFLSYFKFTFVRNPWDRLVSTYSYMRQPGRDAAVTAFARRTLSRFSDFDQFVRGWIPGNALHSPIRHFHTQSSWIVLDGRVGIDFVGRLERIEADFAIIAARLGLSTALPHVNASARERDYRTYYTAESRRIVADVYREDVERFGYVF